MVHRWLREVGEQTPELRDLEFAGLHERGGQISQLAARKHDGSIAHPRFWRTSHPSADEDAMKAAPPSDPYVQMSDEFIPGLGTLFVSPDTMPAGPFLAYDHAGKLSASIYMTPLEDLENGTADDELGIGSHAVSSVDVYYNAGIPGSRSRMHSGPLPRCASRRTELDSLRKGFPSSGQPFLSIIPVKTSPTFAHNSQRSGFDVNLSALSLEHPSLTPLSNKDYKIKAPAGLRPAAGFRRYLVLASTQRPAASL
ncbi:hypothetical protein [Antarcticimicrobium sediminis]|uniref:Uncharacterized protein n=1 Tax=Antarcticimicrobium sediminis TaxID=2546227 RepID=A0A4R5EJU4_9RHOB|nr:hypothetical protein [Antarcticimicrobium sediminis]TDE34640.1 hypothetical protein E1B25_19070 [Antarcticimicrobium sediminis]